VRLWYRFCRLICQAGFLLFFRGRVFGTQRVPRKGGVLLVCNHQSFFDPVLATLALPRECHYMARETLFANRFFRRLIESLNAFPIKRGAADVGAIKETLRRLRAGNLVVSFPEGTRSPDGELGPLAPGPLLVARKAGVPIVPTVILGAFEAWPRHCRWPRPHPVIVAYGPPVAPQTLEELDEAGCLELIRRRLLDLIDRYRQHGLLRSCPRARPPARISSAQAVRPAG
jgi:1-acyl-sn-glycerol-3-phosphate acyltransferase